MSRDDLSETSTMKLTGTSLLMGINRQYRWFSIQIRPVQFLLIFYLRNDELLTNSRFDSIFPVSFDVC